VIDGSKRPSAFVAVLASFLKHGADSEVRRRTSIPGLVVIRPRCGRGVSTIFLQTAKPVLFLGILCHAPPNTEYLIVVSSVNAKAVISY
jgi:hypothetical protein